MYKSLTEESSTITLTLDRIEGSKAVLVGGRDEIVVPKKILPKQVREGGAVSLTLATDEAEREKREIRAKELLNEILRSK